MLTIKQNVFRRAAFTLLLAALSSTGAWAQEMAKGIVVWLAGGKKTSVLFRDLPEFTYDDSNVTLKSKTMDLSWPLANLQKLTFEDVDTAIKDLKAGDLDLLSDQFDAYDLSGKLIRKGINSLSELPKGEYIIKDGSVTNKVVSK